MNLATVLRHSDLLDAGDIGQLAVVVTSGLQSMKDLSVRRDDHLFFGMSTSAAAAAARNATVYSQPLDNDIYTVKINIYTPGIFVLPLWCRLQLINKANVWYKSSAVPAKNNNATYWSPSNREIFTFSFFFRRIGSRSFLQRKNGVPSHR